MVRGNGVKYNNWNTQVKCLRNKVTVLLLSMYHSVLKCNNIEPVLDLGSRLLAMSNLNSLVVRTAALNTSTVICLSSAYCLIDDSPSISALFLLSTVYVSADRFMFEPPVWLHTNSYRCRPADQLPNFQAETAFSLISLSSVSVINHISETTATLKF